MPLIESYARLNDKCITISSIHTFSWVFILHLQIYWTVIKSIDEPMMTINPTASAMTKRLTHQS